MNDLTKEELKKAILKSLPAFHELTPRLMEQHLVWKRQANGWHGEYQQRPCLLQIFLANDKFIEEASIGFNKALAFEYPHLDGFVSCAGTCMSFAKNQSRLVQRMISGLWDKYKTFKCDEFQINSIINECANFIDFETTPVRYQTQLLNFMMDADTLQFPNELIVRRLNEQEMTELYGGPLTSLSFWKPQHPNMNEFVVERIFNEEVIWGPNQSTEKRNQFIDNVDKLILALRTFKTGPIGHGEIHAQFLNFCPLGTPAVTFQNEYVPFGNYQIDRKEIESFQNHTNLVSSLSEPVMEIACLQLAAASNRLRPQDMILDAVIGMESLLLPVGGKGELKYKGESRYRFSLNYSTLFDSPTERHRQFHVARDLYDHRSSIAHGGGVNDQTYKIGEEKLTLADAGKRATEALRNLIQRFLPSAKDAPYKKHEYWERAYFGL